MYVKHASGIRQTDIVNVAAKLNKEENDGVDESGICTAKKRRLNSSQKQAIITNYSDDVLLG
jgi:hypothetical protein